jgi:bacterioferritin-associated ferredoxin
MYVCHCGAVNDRTVRAAADAGALTVDDLTRACGAGGDCGGCHATLEELLDLCATANGRVPELVG